MQLGLAGFAAVLYGISDFIGGVATAKRRGLTVARTTQTTALLIAIPYVTLFSPGRPTDGIGWGIGAGACQAVGIAALYMALSEGPVRTVAQVAAVVGVGLPVLVGLFLGERPSTLQSLGVCFGLAGILLTSAATGGSLGQRKATRSTLIMATVAGGCLSIGIIFLSRTDPSTGWWPAFAARLTSVGVLWAALPFEPRRISATSSLKLPVGGGLLEGIANLCIARALQTGSLILVSVVGALFPAVTILLGNIILKEEMTLVQRLGLTLAVASIVLMNSG